MSNHYRNSLIRPQVQRRIAPEARRSAPVPRHVQANFERWIDAARSNNATRLKALTAVLRRAGFEPRILSRNKFELRRLS